MQVPHHSGAEVVRIAHESGDADLLCLAYATHGSAHHIQTQEKADRVMHRALWLHSVRYSTEPSLAGQAKLLRLALEQDAPDLFDRVPGLWWNNLPEYARHEPDLFEIPAPALAGKMGEMLAFGRECHACGARGALGDDAEATLMQAISSGWHRTAVLVLLLGYRLSDRNRSAIAEASPALADLDHLLGASTRSAHERIRQVALERHDVFSRLLAMAPGQEPEHYVSGLLGRQTGHVAQ